jgi:hypothetical protein
MPTGTINGANAGKHRIGIKVRSVIPATVVVPNAEFVRRDKFGRLSFKLSEQLYEELTAKAEAMCPEAVTIPVMYDDFKHVRVIRGKVIKGSGIEVPDEEDQMPVIREDEFPHTMEEGGTYKVKGHLKVTRLGTPPQPCVYFSITLIEPVDPPPPALEREPTSTLKKVKTKVKPEPVKGKAKAKSAPAAEVEDEADSDGSD